MPVRDSCLSVCMRMPPCGKSKQGRRHAFAPAHPKDEQKRQCSCSRTSFCHGSPIDLARSHVLIPRVAIGTPPPARQASQERRSSLRFAIGTAPSSDSFSNQLRHHVRNTQRHQTKRAPTAWPRRCSWRYSSPALSPAPAAARSCASSFAVTQWKHGRWSSLAGGKGRKHRPKVKLHTFVVGGPTYITKPATSITAAYID